MKTKYYPTINFLRAIAALMVCFYHFILYEDGNATLFEPSSMVYKIGEYGLQGVYIFFVITGFVIPLSMLKHSYSYKQFFRFLLRRWLRIELPYLGSIFLVLIVISAFKIYNNVSLDFSFKQLIYHIFYLIPFSKFTWYNSIYWTLAIELQFYLLLAFIYPLLTHRYIALKITTVLCFLVSSYFVSDTRFVFNYSGIFCSGIFLFYYLQGILDKYIAWLLITISIAMISFVNGTEIAIISSVTVFIIAFIQINKKGLNFLGDISYSLYLTHGLIGGQIIYFFGRYLQNNFLKISLVLLAVILSTGFAFFFWRIIEKPALKLSKKVKLLLIPENK